MGVARPLNGLLIACSLSLAVGSAQAVVRRADPGPVSTLAAIEAALAHRPQATVGQTVVVRALAAPCPWWGATARRRHCAGQLLVLIGMATDAPTEPLPLVRPAPAPLWTILRQLPWLGDRLRRRVPVDPFVPAQYRVRLLTLPACPHAGCYAALLLAAMPQSRQGV